LARLGIELARAGGLRRTHRLLLSPGTLGPLAWLAANEGRLDGIHAGLAVMCVGDPGRFTYKRTRHGNAIVDRALALALRDSGAEHSITDFVPWGGDERQFASPGFDLPVGAFSRTPPGAFVENHTSADDLDFVSADALGESLEVVLSALAALESDRRYLSLNPKGEPQLGRRGLSRRMGGQKGGSSEMALFWNLNLADGSHGVLDVAERSGLSVAEVADAAAALVASGLLVEVAEAQ
jgi:aminopeptidase-like protein